MSGTAVTLSTDPTNTVFAITKAQTPPPPPTPTVPVFPKDPVYLTLSGSSNQVVGTCVSKAIVQTSDISLAGTQ